MGSHTKVSNPLCLEVVREAMICDCSTLEAVREAVICDHPIQEGAGKQQCTITSPREQEGDNNMQLLNPGSRILSMLSYFPSRLLEKIMNKKDYKLKEKDRKL